MSKKVKYHGIIAVSNSLRGATDQYKRLAMGQDAPTVLVDADRSVAFITTANAETDYGNPITGNMDMSPMPALLEKVNFNSLSGELTANHYYCKASCGSHIVADSKDIKNCPVCYSTLAADDSDDEDEDQDDDDDIDLDDSDDSDDSDDDSEDGDDDSSESADDDEPLSLDDSEDDDSDDSEDEDSDDDSGDDSDVKESDLDLEDDDSDADTDDADDSEDDESDEDDDGAGSDDDDEEESDDDSSESASKKPGSRRVTVEAADDSDDSDDDSEDSDDDSDDEESDEDDDSDGDDSDDEEDDSDDDSDADDESESAVASAGINFQDALSVYTQAKMESGSLSSEAEAFPNYVVCSGCHSHLLSDEPLHECVHCGSFDLEEPTDAPDGSYDGAGLDLGFDDDEESDEDDDGDGEEDVALDADGNPIETDLDEPVVATTKPVAPNVPVEIVKYDPLESVVASDAAADKLDLSYSTVLNGKSTWQAHYAGTLVAQAHAEDVGSAADVFNTQKFGHAVHAAVRELGVKAALKEFGFKPTIVEISVSAEVKKQAQVLAAEFKAESDAEFNKRVDNFLSALSTAAVGINRGFFPNVINPLKRGLWDVMSAAGMHNPESAIDRVFASGSDEYHQILLEKAREILAHPVEVQASLATAIKNSNYMTVASAEEVEESQRTVAQVLNGGLGTSVSSTQSEKVVNFSSQSSDADELANKRASVISRLGSSRR